VFRAGDKVTPLRNNYDKGAAGVFNGTVGVVTGISLEDHTLAVLTDEDEQVDYGFDEPASWHTPTRPAGRERVPGAGGVADRPARGGGPVVVPVAGPYPVAGRASFYYQRRHRHLAERARFGLVGEYQFRTRVRQAPPGLRWAEGGHHSGG
jgi:hypothetical protein